MRGKTFPVRNGPLQRATVDTSQLGDSSMLLLMGEVLEIERKPYRKTDKETGEVTNGTVTIAHVRDGKRFSRACLVPDDFAPVPVEDEELTAEVRVFPSQNVRGIDWQLVRRVDPASLVPARAAG